MSVAPPTLPYPPVLGILHLIERQGWGGVEMTSGRIRLGTAALVTWGDRLLLGRRGKEPNHGMWILPGGGIDFGETQESALKRELAEEAGIEIRLTGLMGVYEIIVEPDEHRLIVYRFAEALSGDVRASSDLLEAKFLTKDEITELDRAGQVTPLVRRVLADSGWLE